MKFALFDNCGKGAYLRQRLIAAGHTASERVEDTDVLVLDCDWRWAHPRPAMIDAAVAAGARVVLYPHGGMPTVFVYDGLTDPDERVALRLEHGPGSIDVARLFGAEHKLNQHAAGWLFSPTAPFTPRSEPGRVLFAPMHPNIEAMQKGASAIDPAPALNQRIYKELLDAGYDVTVSVVGPQFRNGVWPHPRATFADNHEMSFQQSFELVRQADSVVAAGSLGALGVALGKPTVMFGQGDFSDYVDGRYQRAAHAGLYTAAARYPLDCEDGHVSDLLARACKGDAGAAEWRTAFVGEDGTEAAIRLIEKLAHEVLPEQAKYEASTQEAGVRETPEEPQGEEPEGDETGTDEESEPKAEQKNVVIGGVTARAAARGN